MTHITIERAKLEQVLEALEKAESRDGYFTYITAIEVLREALAAQPAVQEPFGYLEIDDIESQREYPHNCRNVNLWHEGGQGMAAIYTTPPAQPAVPDALTSADIQEHIEYVAGWNECRQAMLEMLK
jgi:hypothetical protein